MQGDVFYLVSTEEEQENKLMEYFTQILDNPNYDGVTFMTPFMTPNHKYPFSMKNIMKKSSFLQHEPAERLQITQLGSKPYPVKNWLKKET